MARGITRADGVRGWLKNGIPAGVMLQDIEVEPPKLAKGENVGRCH